MIASVPLGEPSTAIPPLVEWEGWQSIGAAVNQWVLNAKVWAGGPSDTVVDYVGREPTPVVITDGRLLSVATLLTVLALAVFLGRLCWMINHKIVPELQAIKRQTTTGLVEPDAAARVGATGPGEL